MRRVIILTLILMLGLNAHAEDAINPQQEIERHPGDFTVAVKHLGDILNDRFRKDIFTELNASRVARPNETVHYAATRILALERMGKISVHSPEVKSAFTYEFLTARSDSTRLHEAIALYKRIAVANADDPYWRLIRARCARLMELPETLELYEQVAADMTGVATDESLRQAWEANREEFNLPAYTKEAWRRQTTQFVYDGKGPDVPGSLTIPASFLPLLDIAGAVGSDAVDWETALDDPSNTSAMMLDHLYGEAKKFGELPWLDGRGFLNTEHVLARQLLSHPPETVAKLREFQEQAFKKATLGGVETGEELALFRRFPWSASAQAILLNLAQQHIFQGEPQAAYRGFQDVLRYAQSKDLREQAQVGLWLSLSQFADPNVVAQAFEDIDTQDTWPWYGKRETTGTIRQQLLKHEPEQTPDPTLASLKQHTVRIPPTPQGSVKQPVFSLDMQRNGSGLLVSSESMLLMYNATNTAKPAWSYIRRLHGESSGAKYVLPIFGENQLIARWTGGHGSDNPLVAVRRADGTIDSEGNPHDPQSRYLYRTIGSPAAADEKAYAVQFQQPYLSIYGHPERRNWGDVTLSCFACNDLKHQWTRTYPSAQTNETPRGKRFNSVLPTVSQGAVFFCTNDGHVIRADARDGEMEWIHFFRPNTGDNYSQPPSRWCLGSKPIVTEDKVICMPKFTGYLFALDKATGRRIWRTPLLRSHEVLGRHGKNIVLISANSIYAIDLDTGQLRWGRQITPSSDESGRPARPEYADGFQLPRAQLIGSSVYCGTKKMLYRFDASNGARLESRPWKMGGEVPMTFLVSNSDLYVISDLPMKDTTWEHRLAQYHTVIYPAGSHGVQVRPVEMNDGSVVIWRDGMLIRMKGDQILWSRLLSNAAVYGSRMSERDGKIHMSWPAMRSGASAIYDATTGRLLSMRRSGTSNDILFD